MRVATVEGTSLTAADSEFASCTCTMSRCRSKGNALHRGTPTMCKLG